MKLNLRRSRIMMGGNSEMIHKLGGQLTVRGLQASWCATPEQLGLENYLPGMAQ